MFYNLLKSDKPNSYLADIEQQAQNFFSRLVRALAEKESIIEELKAIDMMPWGEENEQHS